MGGNVIAVAMLLLAQTPVAAPPALSGIGRQALPRQGCAAFLWQSGATPRLVAMASGAGLRVGIDGREATLPRAGAGGEVRLGLPATSDYAAPGVTARLELTIASESDMVDGARIPSGTLSVSRPGGDAAVVPVAGLIGCARSAQ